MKGLLIALISTIVIEFVVLLLLGERRKRVLWSSVAVNIITNVPLNLYMLYVRHSASDIIFVRDLRQAAVYSILCNATSLIIGMLVTALNLQFAISNLKKQEICFYLTSFTSHHSQRKSTHW